MNIKFSFIVLCSVDLYIRDKENNEKTNETLEHFIMWIAQLS
jgi:hypothetical protein